jgi:hypothetical protein
VDLQEDRQQPHLVRLLTAFDSLLTARERRPLLQVCLYLFQATSLRLRHEGANEEEGQDPDHGVSQEHRPWPEGGKQAGERLRDYKVGYPVQEDRHSHGGSPDP